MEVSIFPLLLTALSCAAGITEYCAGISIGYAHKKMAVQYKILVLLFCVLNVLWSYIYFPLLIFYILQYLLKLLYRAGDVKQRAPSLFLLNLGYVNFLVLHLITVGTAAFFRGVAMHTLLEEPFWRMITVSVCMGISIIENIVVLKWNAFSKGLAEESGSEEGKLLMVFLWFCAGYLLVDSLLCTSGSELFYTPLFLIGSCAIVMSFLFLYLWHIYSMLQNNYLKEEQIKLETELEIYDRNARVFRQMTEKDAMTGAYSRQYGLECLENLLKRGENFTTVFLDLDHLKQINDEQGHEAGDRYLIGFVNAVNSFLEEDERIIRMGGDEFMLLMPGSSPESVKRRLEELRGSMEQNAVQPYYFSYGISYCPSGEGYNSEKLIQEADKNMYLDKRRRH